MNRIAIGQSDLRASSIALGCMRVDALRPRDLAELIVTAVDAGIDTFDHADIYGDGRCEAAFGQALKTAGVKRDDLIIETKAGIRNGFLDLSAKHILESVDDSLDRLGTDYLDLFLLHRPDTLVEPAEVAEAFDILHDAGKVRHFGVSNHNGTQIDVLAAHVRQPIVVNQLQFSVAHTGMIDAGLNVNMTVPSASDRDGRVLDYCRLKGITIQPWSVLQYGFFAGTFLGSDEYVALNAALDETAAELGVSPAAVAISWILRHPARMQPVIGTTNPHRVREIAKAADVEITRERWYGLYRAAGNVLP